MARKDSLTAITSPAARSPLNLNLDYLANEIDSLEANLQQQITHNSHDIINLQKQIESKEGEFNTGSSNILFENINGIPTVLQKSPTKNAYISPDGKYYLDSSVTANAIIQVVYDFTRQKECVFIKKVDA